MDYELNASFFMGEARLTLGIVIPNEGETKPTAKGALALFAI